MEEFILKKYCSSLNDIAMNAKCYMSIITTYTRIVQKSNDVKARYGNQNGNSFLVTKLIADLSVFVYESINFINSIEDNTLKKAIQDLYQKSYYNDLKLIRNNIHLYNPYGSSKDKADNIINSQLEDFNMKEHDWLYPWRNDTALIYKIADNKGVILGSDYFYRYYLYEANGASWTDEQKVKYSNTTFNIVFFLSTNIVDFKVPMINLKNVDMHIEFFDNKSELVFKNLNVDYNIAHRFILILTELSYISILVDDILDTRNLHSVNIKWILFLGKYVATKYDEALDSIENLLKHSKDNIYLQKLFINNSTNISNLNSRKFGHDLRNMLHFGLLDIKEQEYDDISKLRLTKLYLLKTRTNSIEEFITKYLLMRNEMKIIESKIRDILKLERSF